MTWLIVNLITSKYEIAFTIIHYRMPNLTLRGDK